jgi:hypothetical protein
MSVGALGASPFVLHSHLPYANLTGQWPHSEESALELSEPLLAYLNHLKGAGVEENLTVAIESVLDEQIVKDLERFVIFPEAAKFDDEEEEELYEDEDFDEDDLDEDFDEDDLDDLDDDDFDDDDFEEDDDLYDSIGVDSPDWWIAVPEMIDSDSLRFFEGTASALNIRGDARRLWGHNYNFSKN